MELERPIMQSIGAIEQRIASEMNVEALAGTVFLSKHYFQRLFHAVAGEPVMDYVRKRRLSLAGRELCENSASVLTIAIKYGYGSHEAFTRAFKAFHGITPSECRKYGVYNYREMISVMKNEQKNNGQITDMTRTRLVESAQTAVKILNEFAVRAQQTAERTEETARNTGLPYTNYSVLSCETRHLSGRVQAVCRSMESPEQPAYFIAAYDNAMQLIKTLDEIAFQTFLLALNAGIQVWRSQVRTHPEYLEIKAAYDDLAQDISTKNGAVTKLLLDLTRFIEGDVREEINKIVTDSLNDLTGLAEEVKRISAVIRAEALETEWDRDSFLLSADETDRIAEGISQMAEKAANDYHQCASAGKPDELRKWFTEGASMLRVLEDLAFRGNILILQMSLDIQRSPQSNVLADAIERLRPLVGRLHEANNRRTRAFEEAVDYAALLVSDHAQDEGRLLAKKLADVAFQADLFSYYTRTEWAKLKHAGGSGFSSDVERTVSLASEAQRIYERFAAEGDVVLAKKAFDALREGFCSLGSDLQTHAEALGETGQVMAYFGKQYTGFANGM